MIIIALTYQKWFSRFNTYFQFPTFLRQKQWKKVHQVTHLQTEHYFSIVVVYLSRYNTITITTFCLTLYEPSKIYFWPTLPANKHNSVRSHLLPVYQEPVKIYSTIFFSSQMSNVKCQMQIHFTFMTFKRKTPTNSFKLQYKVRWCALWKCAETSDCLWCLNASVGNIF